MIDLHFKMKSQLTAQIYYESHLNFSPSSLRGTVYNISDKPNVRAEVLVGVTTRLLDLENVRYF